MPKIQLTKDIHGRLKGEVLAVDDASAKALIERGDAVAYHAGRGGKVVAPRPKPGASHVARVADPDYPAPGATSKGGTRVTAPAPAPARAPAPAAASAQEPPAADVEKAPPAPPRKASGQRPTAHQ